MSFLIKNNKQIKEDVKIELTKSFAEHITDAYQQGKADMIDECIEIVKNSYRMDALEKLQNLKQNLVE